MGGGSPDKGALGKLSQYLFLIVMTAMFHDIHQEEVSAHRPVHTNFDALLYADDTVCISEDTRAINRHLERIENHGRRYGLRLNKAKCEVITNVRRPNVHFPDGTKVKIVEEAKYLRCHVCRFLGKRVRRCRIVHRGCG